MNNVHDRSRIDCAPDCAAFPGLRVDWDERSGSADPWTLVLAHGAGQGMDSPFMQFIAQFIAAQGFRVLRFEFPYMAWMRSTGKRRPPDPAPRLMAAWGEILDRLPSDRLVIGGKSMGGRMASLVAAERRPAGLVCLGYPFHPPGKPERTRVDHLEDLRVPTLICQGTRDPFGRPEEVAGYPLSPSIRLEWITDGEHSFKPRLSSGRTWEQNLSQGADAVVAMMRELAQISSRLRLKP